MVYTYTPTYYSSLHDSITSLCKNILPFSFKKRRLPPAEHRLSKLQSDNLKWQQDSYHQILNLIGLRKEGILSENEVSAFRSHLLDTLIASPPEREEPVILRDKLVFLQELLYAKCISEEEYHSSKRPLLQRLAVQGVEIEARDVIVAGPKEQKESLEEEWSVIDLKSENKLVIKDEKLASMNNRSKPNSTIKQIKEAASVFGFGSSGKHKEKSIFEIEAKRLSSNNCDSTSCTENPFWGHKESETKSILMQESLKNESVKENGSVDKTKRKPFRTLFQKEQKVTQGSGNSRDDCVEERVSKSAKKHWGFEFNKWKKNDSDDETVPLPLNSERSDGESFVYSPMGEGPNTKLIKKKLHSDGSASDFFIDKVLGDKIKKELTRIQAELSTTNPNLKFSDDQMEAISTKLPVDKADLKQFFPKSWCDRYGDVVLDVVKKEFKDHVGEMENLRNAAIEKQSSINNDNDNLSSQWACTFEEDENENFHPNLFIRNRDNKNLDNNPFFRGSNDQNPFWSPRQF